MLSDTAREVLDFVGENDVKFVRLALCDLFGRPKNIAVMADQLPRAFEQGIPFDASAVPGFRGSRWAPICCWHRTVPPLPLCRGVPPRDVWCG